MYVQVAIFSMVAFIRAERLKDVSPEYRGQKKRCASSIRQVTSLQSQNAMQIVSIMGCYRSKIKQNNSLISHNARKNRARGACLPLLKIVGKVMVHCHWCAGSLDNQQEFCVINALLVPVSKLVQ